MIYKYVLNDIRRMNSHHQNNKINQQIRAFVSGYIPKHTDKTAQKSLKLLMELYKRNVWTDNRTVNIIAEACFAPSSRSRMMACHFLMETTMPLEELPDSDDEPVNPADLKPKKGVVRQTKHKEKKLEKEKKKAARRLRKREIESRNTNFMPIDLIYNPQVFAEKLFNIMSGKNEKYAHKIIYMSLIARVIWRHNLILLPFYRSLIKYLEPKQKDVHHVLSALAESVHEVVPEDEIETLVKHIIEHFVNDRCSEFTMTIGLNTLREIFKKLPSIITEEMMLYLTTYYEYRNKNVSRAAKSVINYVREYNRDLLPKKFRGKERHDGEEEEEENEEGGKRIPGVEFLEQKGNVHVEIDRILTEEDFKRMKKCMKKKED
jgi:protein SDA1